MFVVILAAAVLFITPSWVSDLGPIPDAIEYAVTAQRLAHLKPFDLLLLGEEYPSRYPFGFPAFLAPAYWLPGARLATGIYGVLVAGVGAVALTYGLARRLGGRLAGVAAALTLLLRPNFIEWNHQIMTESLSAALAVLAGFLLHQAARAERRRLRGHLVALTAVCGFAILVRYTNVVLTVAAVLGYVACRLVQRERNAGLGWMSHVLLLLVGPALAVGALAIYQQATFGSALSTGYGYWLPAWRGFSGPMFSPRYAFVAPRAPAEGPLGGWPNAAYYAAYLATRISSPLLLWPAIGGVLVLFRRRDHPSVAFAWYLASCMLLLYLIYSLYWYQSGRFLVPVLPLAAVLTGVGLQQGAEGARRGKALGWILLVCWCAGAVATLPRIAKQSYLIQRYARGHREPHTYPLLGRSLEAYAAVGPADVTIVTALPLALLDSGLIGHRRIIPLVRRHYWKHSRLEGVPTLGEQRPAVDTALSRGALVYTDAYSLAAVRNNPEYQSERRAVEAYRLAPVVTSARSGRVLLFRLLPAHDKPATGVHGRTGGARGARGNRPTHRAGSARTAIIAGVRAEGGALTPPGGV